ncbi:hypothetical protein JHW45_06905 [Paracoccus stylophorae]|uniref:Uncharacterized protein n=1 Tax=Paracoccus stylophorae TaxID=659350 RepID=A0ABY7SYC7_9RHOB|nr:hypothetical protein [Paracoccus stylophorae]WCR12065.1 hypothetical protein JHW45_06905 [Paracoccus stylophorae]
MFEWISDHSTFVQASVGIVTALVWVIYLHILVSGLRRQRRSEILITLAGARDLSGRILVSNLGFEPIYILDILLRSRAEADERTVSVAERTEVRFEDRTSSDQVTLQMPLKSGDFVDIGQFETLLRRARPSASQHGDASDLTHVEITVVAVTAATTSIVAARRGFGIERSGKDRISLRADSLYARQIRRRRERRRIERQLEDLL